MSENALIPLKAKAINTTSASPIVPAIVAAASDGAARRFLEFFAVTIDNPNTRAAYFHSEQTEYVDNSYSDFPPTEGRESDGPLQHYPENYPEIPHDIFEPSYDTEEGLDERAVTIGLLPCLESDEEQAATASPPSAPDLVKISKASRGRAGLDKTGPLVRNRDEEEAAEPGYEFGESFQSKVVAFLMFDTTAKVPCSPPERGHKRTSSKQLFKLVALSRGERIQPHSHTERGVANNTPHAGLGCTWW